MKQPQSVDNLKMGNFLYALRKEKGISQTQLGLLLGVTNKAVSKWETGENQPEVAMLYRLADFYRLSVDEIVQGKRKEEQASTKEEKDDLAKRLSALESDERKSAQRFYLVDLYLLSVVLLFFLFTFFALFPFIRFSSDMASNLILGIAFYVAVPLALASLWTGIGLFIRHYQNINPVILFIGLVLFPLSLSALLVLGFVFLFPELRRYHAKAFPKGKTLSRKGKRFATFMGVIYLSLFALAIATSSLGFFFSDKTHFLLSFISVLSLFSLIAVFTIICAFFAKKEEAIA